MVKNRAKIVVNQFLWAFEIKKSAVGDYYASAQKRAAKQRHFFEFASSFAQLKSTLQPC
jgi:hypothetical protein